MTTSDRARELAEEWQVYKACFIPELTALLDLLVEARTWVSNSHEYDCQSNYDPDACSCQARPLIERIDKVLGLEGK